MHKKYWAAGAAMALAGAIATVAWAANINNLSGQSCGASVGEWHFVNTQTGGAAGGSLTATWDSGDSCTVSAAKVNRNNQHFYCDASGELTTAMTNLPGRLVLSDFSCGKEPPCDPKKDPNCK